MNVVDILNWVEKRLSERSTWVGLIALVASFGVTVSPANAQLIEALGAAIAGGLMVFTSDKNIDAAIAAALEDFAKNLQISNTTKATVTTTVSTETPVVTTVTPETPKV